MAILPFVFWGGIYRWILYPAHTSHQPLDMVVLRNNHIVVKSLGHQGYTGGSSAISIAMLLITAGFYPMIIGLINIAVGVVLSDLSWTKDISILACRKVATSGDIVSLLKQKLPIRYSTRAI